MTWTKNGKTIGKIDLRPLLEQWLDDDALWGGHEAANELRWMNEGGGGRIGLTVSQTVALPNGDDLAILNLWWDAYSFRAPIDQILVKLHRNPFTLERIRILGGFGGDLPPTPFRLFSFNGKIVCNEGSRLAEIDSSGRTVREICKWSKTDVPIGVCAHRWLISVSGGSQEDRLCATDLTRGTTFPLVDWNAEGIPAKYKGLGPFRSMHGSMIDEQKPYVLFGLVDYSTGKQRFFSIHLPSGRRADLPGAFDSATVVGPYAFAEADNSLSLFQAGSGRALGTFPINSR